MKPTHELETEKIFIGTLIRCPQRLDEIRGIVKPADLVDDFCREVYRQVLAMSDCGIPTGDASLIAIQLCENNVGRDSVNGTAGALANLLTKAGTGVNLKHYARSLRRLSQYRQLLSVIAMAEKYTTRQENDPEDIATLIETELAAIAATGSGQSKPIGQAIGDYLTEATSTDRPPGIGTGVHQIDAQFGLWFPGELIIVAARPGMGKSRFLQQLGDAVTSRGRTALLVGLEMRESEYSLRFVCSDHDLDSRELRTRGIDATTAGCIEQSRDARAGQSLYMWSPPEAKISDIAVEARRIKAQHGLSLLAVDYLQLITPTAGKTLYERVTQTSRDLKQLARSLNVPLVAACQLNREADGVVPELKHLRDSGAIEQDADVVVMLHRDAKDDSQAVYRVAKSRQSVTGDMEMTFSILGGFQPATVFA